MRIGLVCPYALDVPGGVQAHVLGLAAFLRRDGHQVSVLSPMDGPIEGRGDAPADWASPSPVPAATSRSTNEPAPGPAPDVALDEGAGERPAAAREEGWEHVTRAGRAVAVPYNGAVARVGFGPVVAVRVRRWLARGRFDVLHLHEPITPSVSLLALWASAGPIVATFHTASLRSRALLAAGPLLSGSLDKVTARLAVSETARQRLADHLGIDAVVVPNGLDVDFFARARPTGRWRGVAGAPTVAFVGRLGEPRKGLAVLAAALPALRTVHPGLRVLVAGPGDATDLPPRPPAAIAAMEFLGVLTECDKASLLASADVYVAPQTGGESFGVVVAEAMAVGTPVVASALPAFSALLDQGRLGRLAAPGDPADLARAVLDVLADRAAALRRAEAACGAVRDYDWTHVGHQVLSVYETVVGAAGGGVGEGPGAQRVLARWRGLA